MVDNAVGRTLLYFFLNRALVMNREFFLHDYI